MWDTVEWIKSLGFIVDGYSVAGAGRRAVVSVKVEPKDLIEAANKIQDAIRSRGFYDRTHVRAEFYPSDGNACVEIIGIDDLALALATKFGPVKPGP